MQLSKSDYMLFLKHPAWLWLKKHDKSKLPPIDDATQAIFDAGFVFETYAELLFPEAVRVSSEMSGYQAYLDLIPQTKKTLKSDNKAIFQARFEVEGITCICDVLVRTGSQTFDLYEIKSSTSVKPDHMLDLAFQAEVLERSGLAVDRFFVVHVNYDYIRQGKINTRKLTKTVEVTKEIKKLKEFTKENIKKAFAVALLRECPNITPAKAKFGAFSDWLTIYKTLAEIDEYSIYHLCSSGPVKIGELEALGINRMIDIPDNYPLDLRQQRQVEATKKNKALVDTKKIKAFLSRITYPLYFLDYETLSSVVPYFDGLGPYKQLPFQYSLHVIPKKGDKPKHFEYLHTSNASPVKPLTEALKSQIGTEGTVLVWFEGFEKSCNELMAKISPEYQAFFKSLNKRIVDLMVPFSTGAYVHKDFFGSASIKKVLPVLIPELSYQDLDINQGADAQRQWMEAVLDGKRAMEKDKILSDLLKYCELDTLAMVRIYELLEKEVFSRTPSLFDWD